MNKKREKIRPSSARTRKGATVRRKNWTVCARKNKGFQNFCLTAKRSENSVRNMDRKGKGKSGYVSIRELAARLGISKATVSLALNNSPRVNKSTAEKIRRAAKKAGYQRNTMVSTMMSSMRKSTIGGFREVVALLNGNKDKNAFKNHTTFPQYKAGIDEEAAELGFKIDEFWLLDPALTRKKLSAILHARGIRGCIVLGHTEEGAFEPYSKIWDDFKIVSVGISVHNPAYEHVSSNQFEVARAATENLVKMGFRRPALVLDERIDGLVDGRFYGGFFRAQFDMPKADRIPPFIENIQSPTYYKNLEKFLARENPDVVMYMLGETGDFLYHKLRRADGSRYPIVQLERRNDCTIPPTYWSGMEQNNHIAGHLAVRRLATLLNITPPPPPPQPEFRNPHSADVDCLRSPQAAGCGSTQGGGGQKRRFGKIRKTRKKITRDKNGTQNQRPQNARPEENPARSARLRDYRSRQRSRNGAKAGSQPRYGLQDARDRREIGGALRLYDSRGGGARP